MKLRLAQGDDVGARPFLEVVPAGSHSVPQVLIGTQAPPHLYATVTLRQLRAFLCRYDDDGNQVAP